MSFFFFCSDNNFSYENRDVYQKLSMSNVVYERPADGTSNKSRPSSPRVDASWVETVGFKELMLLASEIVRPES
jgi:hypothetical protein